MGKWNIIPIQLTPCTMRLPTYLWNQSNEASNLASVNKSFHLNPIVIDSFLPVRNMVVSNMSVVTHYSQVEIVEFCASCREDKNDRVLTISSLSMNNLVGCGAPLAQKSLLHSINCKKESALLHLNRFFMDDTQMHEAEHHLSRDLDPNYQIRSSQGYVDKTHIRVLSFLITPWKYMYKLIRDHYMIQISYCDGPYLERNQFLF